MSRQQQAACRGVMFSDRPSVRPLSVRVTTYFASLDNLCT